MTKYQLVRVSKSSTVRSTISDVWEMRLAWWFTARTRARFARTFLGSFWLGLSNLLSIAALALVYGTVFKVQDFSTYVVYLGIGLVVWNGISSAIGSAPNLFEHNQAQVHNTNLNPIFYVLEEWAFQVQTFLQSFALVLLALSWFSTVCCSFSGLFAGSAEFILFLFWAPTIVVFLELGTAISISWSNCTQLVFLLSPILYRKDILGAMAWTANLNPLYRVLSPVRHSLWLGCSGLLVCCCWFLTSVYGLRCIG